MTFSLDQRRYRLNLTKKQLHEECLKRGRKIGYSSVCTTIENPGELLYTTEKKVIDTIAEIEAERRITDIEF